MTTIAVTGATGHVGGLVAAGLGARVDRLVVRDRTRLHGVDHGVGVVETTYGDREGSTAALRGVDAVFMVSAAESPHRREEHRSFIRAAADAGVSHIVYTSFFGASPDAVFTLGRDHADAEAAIRESGMTFTLLRDNFYSDILPLFADENGVISGPAGDGRVAAVARADVADVAIAVLSDLGAHEGAIYELTGPEAVTLSDAAARFSSSLGRPFAFQDQNMDEAYASRRVWSTEQWQLDAWVSTYTAIRDGEVERVTTDVERVAGHPARTLEEALAAG